MDQYQPPRKLKKHPKSRNVPDLRDPQSISRINRKRKKGALSGMVDAEVKAQFAQLCHLRQLNPWRYIEALMYEECRLYGFDPSGYLLPEFRTEHLLGKEIPRLGLKLGPDTKNWTPYGFGQ